MKRNNIIIIISAIIFFGSCHKGFLDERSSKSLVVPETLQDYQAILDNTAVMNMAAYASIYMDGDFEFPDVTLTNQTAFARNCYLWKVDLYETLLTTPGWTNPYKQVLAANVTLEGLSKIKASQENLNQYNQILGSAYFFRGFAFQEAVVLFTESYQEQTANTTLGLPLKLSADATSIMQRASLKATYEQIISDLNKAIELLPVNQSVISSPSKVAAYAQLARVYLNMGKYDLALINAKAALNLKSVLLDFNTVPISSTRTFPNPFVNINPEILFFARDNAGPLNNSAFLLKPSIFATYSDNDLRKTRFFSITRKYIGMYTGSNFTFSGLSTNEVYLIAAECEARANRPNDALGYLNTLCERRYNNTFLAYQSNNSELVLNWVLAERKKELVTRRRWEDLRRLNLDSRFQETLTRTYLGTTYTLPPNSSRYIMTIPQEEIGNSGIVQNDRKLD